MIPSRDRVKSGHIGFPRVGGGDPSTKKTLVKQKSFPRVGGGDPQVCRVTFILILFSPRRRG